MSSVRLLLTTDAIGGVWVYSLELARALRAFGMDTVLAILGPPANPEQLGEASEFRVVQTGLPLEWIDGDASQIARAGQELAQIAADEVVDIVQVSSAAFLSGGDFRQPCVAVQHSCVASWWAAVKQTPLAREFDWRRQFVKRGLDRAAAVIAPSLAFAAETSRIYGVSATAVHNGRTPIACRTIPQGDFVFTAGRLWDEGKNIAVLDRAAERLAVPFQAAGSCAGPNGASVNTRHVTMLGELRQERLAGLLAARPIYASAALYEPFGLSVLEAAQAGCALVLSDIPTHREIWGSAAIFVDPLKHEAFASAIQDLLDDPDERQQLGLLAAARARHYTPARMARGMIEVYRRVAHATSRSIALAGAA